MACSEGLDNEKLYLVSLAGLDRIAVTKLFLFLARVASARSVRPCAVSARVLLVRTKTTDASVA